MELEQLDIGYLDLYPTFREGSQQRLCRVRDSHWNIPGNRLAAEAIAESLRGLLADHAAFPQPGQQP